MTFVVLAPPVRSCSSMADAMSARLRVRRLSTPTQFPSSGSNESRSSRAVRRQFMAPMPSPVSSTSFSARISTAGKRASSTASPAKVTSTRSSGACQAVFRSLTIVAASGWQSSTASRVVMAGSPARSDASSCSTSRIRTLIPPNPRASRTRSERRRVRAVCSAFQPAVDSY